MYRAGQVNRLRRSHSSFRSSLSSRSRDVATLVWVVAILFAEVAINPSAALMCTQRHQSSTEQVQQGRPSRAQRKKSEQERHRKETEINAPIRPTTLLLSSAWKFLTHEIPRGMKMPVGQTQVYLPLTSGALFAVDLGSGRVLWSVETGPTRLSPIADSDLVLVALEDKSDSPLASVRPVVRAFRSADGTVSWTTGLRASVRSLHLAHGLDLAIASLEDGSIIGLRPNDGSIVWSIVLPSPASGEPATDEQNIFIGLENGVFCAIRLDSHDPHVIQTVRLNDRTSSRPAVTEDSIYAATAGGSLYRLDKERLAVRWKRRIGVTIGSGVELFEKDVIVGSFDNFIYSFTQDAGFPRWKRATDGRLDDGLLRIERTVMVAPLRSSRLLAVSLENGSILSTLDLDSEVGVAGPLSGDHSTIIIPTDEGVFAARVSIISAAVPR